MPRLSTKISLDAQAALAAANSPDASNPFATQDDLVGLGGSGLALSPDGVIGADQSIDAGYIYLVDAGESSVELTLNAPGDATGFAVKVLALGDGEDVTITVTALQIEDQDGSTAGTSFVITDPHTYEEFFFDSDAEIWRRRKSPDASEIALGGDLDGTPDAAKVIAITDADDNSFPIDELVEGEFLKVEGGSIVSASVAGGVALTASAPADVTKVAAAVGVATDAARADHKHNVSTAAPAATGVSTASAEGSATSLARSDHSHQSNTAPANVTKASAAIGTSGEPARADHKHDVSTAAPGSLTVGGSNTEGSASSLARSDHNHALPSSFPIVVKNAGSTIGTRSNLNLIEGTNVTMTVADNGGTGAVDVTINASGGGGVSLTGSAPADVTAATAAVGVGTAAARDDHKHNISTAAASSLTLAGSNSAGSASSLARSDHIHALPATAAPSTLAVGGSNSAGAATSISRSDHVHALPAFGSSSGTFAQGDDSRFPVATFGTGTPPNTGVLTTFMTWTLAHPSTPHSWVVEADLSIVNTGGGDTVGLSFDIGTWSASSKVQDVFAAKFDGGTTYTVARINYATGFTDILFVPMSASDAVFVRAKLRVTINSGSSGTIVLKASSTTGGSTIRGSGTAVRV